MTVRILPKKPRRGLISITPDKKINDFRSLGHETALPTASQRDAISMLRHYANYHLLNPNGKSQLFQSRILG